MAFSLVSIEVVSFERVGRRGRHVLGRIKEVTIVAHRLEVILMISYRGKKHSNNSTSYHSLINVLNDATKISFTLFDKKNAVILIGFVKCHEATAVIWI